MISRVFQNSDDQVDDTPAQPEEYISPAPRVSVQAYCASVAVATAVRAASEDRRLGKAHLSVHMGGIAAAIEAYHTSPTPNVILLETESGAQYPRRARRTRNRLRRRNPRRRDRQRQRRHALS